MRDTRGSWLGFFRLYRDPDRRSVRGVLCWNLRLGNFSLTNGRSEYRHVRLRILKGHGGSSSKMLSLFVRNVISPTALWPGISVRCAPRYDQRASFEGLWLRCHSALDQKSRANRSSNGLPCRIELGTVGHLEHYVREEDGHGGSSWKMLFSFQFVGSEPVAASRLCLSANVS